MYGHEFCRLLTKQISMSIIKERKAHGFAALSVHLRALPLVTDAL